MIGLSARFVAFSGNSECHRKINPETCLGAGEGRVQPIKRVGKNLDGFRHTKSRKCVSSPTSQVYSVQSDVRPLVVGRVGWQQVVSIVECMQARRPVPVRSKRLTARRRKPRTQQLGCMAVCTAAGVNQQVDGVGRSADIDQHERLFTDHMKLERRQTPMLSGRSLTALVMLPGV
ncbi:hypothetical protein [Actinokineospora sp.]|uniref:hypothetical protein n=1 Tax=Actinokineospora sp. TaxID=1872133 RepID=UPI0040382615